MKIKLAALLSIFFCKSIFVYSQVTIGNVEKEEKKALMPVRYDSLNDFSAQDNFIDYYQYVGLKFYLPPSKYYGTLLVGVSCETNALINKYAEKEGNKYYTILDVYDEQTLRAKNLNNLSQRGDNEKYPLEANSPSLGFLIREDSTKACFIMPRPLEGAWKVILVPYFVKQKQLFEGKKLVYDGDRYGFSTHDIKNNNPVQVAQHSRWNCTEVTLLKRNDVDNTASDDDKYYIFLLMNNDKGEQIAFKKGAGSNSGFYGFIPETVFLKREQEKKLKADELAAKQKQDEKTAREKHLNECITKFGQHNGALISQGLVEIGMTTEMCKAAWGFPYDILKTTTASIEKEHWFYSWKSHLYFEKDALVKIEN